MSDPALYGLIITGVVLFIAEQAALVAIGFVAARRVLGETVAENRALKAENRALREELKGAEAVVEDCERRGYIQRTTGRHRGPDKEAGSE